ncbi:hypothetical protein NLJ89_g9844 [Agrocybe chaxingu]|uniref:Uncharacterized protein n=1 Tax=Agrocybe chaxingu TaxID=84603 RepID=A0A9W8JRX5_9AGAR|nr:hypothetical protein NLJ89_g9844 [Agrocybe chaxingu]
MSSNNQQICDAKPLDWALFTLTIVSTHVTWWALPLPTLFRWGFQSYLHDVAWECLRLQVPSYIASTACFGQPRENWECNYYAGVHRPATRIDTAKAFVKDSLIVVSTALALYRLCSGDQNQDLSGINSALWMYPSLPVAVYGLFIVIASRTQVKMWIIVSSALGLIIAIAVAMALVIAFTYGHGIWIPCTVLILMMGLPVWAVAPKLLVIAVFLATMSRFGGPIVGAKPGVVQEMEEIP